MQSSQRNTAAISGAKPAAITNRLTADPCEATARGAKWNKAGG
ncbi:hypothetical protein [Caudoviricetes sp.]|nr:hypothetical protein [Caudoviricetes sp.]